ncbi:hypothetical protein GE09DRAFT_86637 [Coniochaeta sp. 2T2.1]|nr:hypothetical protein GE09DRAFT_86637 [Coniochaeta sp. 2T2.1]
MQRYCYGSQGPRCGGPLAYPENHRRGWTRRRQPPPQPSSARRRHNILASQPLLLPHRKDHQTEPKHDLRIPQWLDSHAVPHTLSRQHLPQLLVTINKQAQQECLGPISASVPLQTGIMYPWCRGPCRSLAITRTTEKLGMSGPVWRCGATLKIPSALRQRGGQATSSLHTSYPFGFSPADQLNEVCFGISHAAPFNSRGSKT